MESVGSYLINARRWRGTFLSRMRTPCVDLCGSTKELRIRGDAAAGIRIPDGRLLCQNHVPEDEFTIPRSAGGVRLLANPDQLRQALQWKML